MQASGTVTIKAEVKQLSQLLNKLGEWTGWRHQFAAHAALSWGPVSLGAGEASSAVAGKAEVK